MEIGAVITQSSSRRMSPRYYLHSDELIVDHDFLGQEVGTDSGFVLTAELFVHILVHQRSFADANG